MKKTIFCLLFGLVLSGCGTKENVAPIPHAPAAGEVKLLEGWTALTNAIAVKTVFRGDEKITPVKFLQPGVVELPVDFSGAKPAARANWDLSLPCNLVEYEGIQFDFYCDDLDQFSNFSCYFKSGDGWYHGSFEAEDSGQWQRVRVWRSQVQSEGKAGGWDQIKKIRISGWRAGTKKFRCAIANVAYLGGGKPEALVVYSASLTEKNKSKDYLYFADRMAGSLRSLGIVTRVVGDTELTADVFRDVSVVVLPYNPSFPPEKVVLLADYVARGGRFLAGYSQAQAVTDLLGVKFEKRMYPQKDSGAAITGFLKTDKALKGQPDFAPQASWMTRVPQRQPGVDVVAEWATAGNKSLGLPALVRTSRGLFMSHVWLGGMDAASSALMRAIVSDLSPSLGTRLAKLVEEEKARAAQVKAWMADRPSKAGERRAIWCHTAYGLGGGHDWDSSVKLIKENGFNMLIPNLCWGGIAFYASSVLPQAASVATKGDAFEQCKAACRKYGVEMHVWKVCWNMGRYTSAEYVKKMHEAGRTQYDAKGVEKERWLCPSHPENQKLEIESMVELAKKGPDGIHFDYIRYPSEDYCYCAGCRARFEAQLGAKVENWPADVKDEKKLRDAWRAFRVANITYVVSNVAVRVRKEAPGVKISAALFRNPQSDPHTIAQDWASWCQAGYLDFACNMDYVNSTPLFRGAVKSQLPAVGKVPLYPGIGLSCWPNDSRDAERLAKQIQAARDLGTHGFTVFALDRRAEQVLPLLRLGVTKED